MTLENYYEQIAYSQKLWGSLREISLVENIGGFISTKTKELVDVGCGDGYLFQYLIQKRKGLRLVGVDISKTRLKRLNEKFSNVKTIKEDITNLPFKANEFQTVVCSEVLEHIPNFKKALDELIRITKKELIITVPNDQPLIKIICPKCKAKHYLAGHINRFNADSLKNLVKEHKDVKITKIRKFHTIYSYNQLTLKLPTFLRIWLDQIFQNLARHISFFKPNYLLIKIIKNE